MDFRAMSIAESPSMSNKAFAADCAYNPPDPIAHTPSSISMQFPYPSSKTVMSASETIMSACSLECIFSVLHCLAKFIHALKV